MSLLAMSSRASRSHGPLALLCALVLLAGALLPAGVATVRANAPPDHLVISEVVTGGASASDEFIEIYNPTPVALPLEGLELVYVSASGLTVSRRAAWTLGAPEVPPGHHVLIANETGAYAAIADALYATGIAATGGSVALRIQGAESAIDGVGWGTAAGTWLEGDPAVAPAAGASIERLPGGMHGSTQDTDDNQNDFVVRPVPDPQNSESAPTPDPTNPLPTAAPVPPTPTPAPTATASPSQSPSPAPTVLDIATARAAPNGTTVTIEGTALTDSTFADGGGFVADGSAGIAVLMSSGSYQRGTLLRVTGTVDDRYSQRTLRATETGVIDLGSGTQAPPVLRATGHIGEAVEGVLVRIAGVIVGSPTMLSAGPAYEVNDGSGPARVLVGSATGIDTGAWSSGTSIELIGVVGQRDSSGTGTSGYRVQPRASADVLGLGGPGSPSATPTSTPIPGDPASTPTPGTDGTLAIAEARAAPKNSRVRVRGVVTLAPGLVSPTSAAIQDASGAILLRVGEEVGPLTVGERIEVGGVRSTLAGMETLRVTEPATRLGSAASPDPLAVGTGDAGEPHEALLLRVRGSIVSSARRAPSGTVSFEINDGSGPLRVYIAAVLGADASELRSGTWVEVVGVLGQETTGAQPLRGYRLWPRTLEDLRITAPLTDAGVATATAARADGTMDGGGTSADPVASLERVGGPDLSELRVGATLVAGPWPELGLAGLLWDGARLVAIDAASSPLVAALLGADRPPMPVELGGLRVTGVEPSSTVPMVALSSVPNDTARRSGPISPPVAGIPDDGEARWTTLVGRIVRSGEALSLEVGAAKVLLEPMCDEHAGPAEGRYGVTGIGLPSPARLVVPCGGWRAAPVLARTVVEARGGDGSPAAARLDGASVTDAPARRPLAAGLLGAAAAALAAGAVARRRWGEEPEPGGTGENRPADGDGPDDGAMPHQLTLVASTQERGSS